MGVGAKRIGEQKMTLKEIWLSRIAKQMEHDSQIEAMDLAGYFPRVTLVKVDGTHSCTMGEFSMDSSSAKRAKVLTCGWCPDPRHPDLARHPDGDALHVEPRKRDAPERRGTNGRKR
jgi:hypothetical protein